MKTQLDRLSTAREERYIVTQYFINRGPQEAQGFCHHALAALQLSVSPINSEYFEREGDIAPLWVAVVDVTSDNTILFHYATEMETKDGVFQAKPPKVGNVRRPWDIHVGDKEGEVSFEAYEQIHFFFQTMKQNGPVFFQIISETPAMGKGKHRWIDAYPVHGKQAVDHARKQWHSGNIGRNSDGVAK